MNGLLPLWKPAGMTSHDCVAKIRKYLGIKKVGHTGTLDPLVEGMLVLCVGEATKIVPYVTKLKKTYIATCTLGIATTTEDQSGEVVEEKKVHKTPSERDIRSVLENFIGDIIQVPPMYSAVKVHGKRLYEYARENKQVERPKRKVTIYACEYLGMKKNTEKPSFKMKVVCSSGTYIRTLCVDIGRQLGYPAHMSALIRSEAGSFTKEEAWTLEQVEKAVQQNTISSMIYPLERGLQHLDHLHVTKEESTRIKHGQLLPVPNRQIKTNPFVMMYNEKVLALYQTHPERENYIKPVRVFNRT